MSKVTRYVLLLVSGVSAWGSVLPAQAQQPSAPLEPLGVPMTPVLGAQPIGGQPLMGPSGPQVWTGQTAHCPDVHVPEFCFPNGAGTLEFMAGTYFKTQVGPIVPTFDFAPINIRLGRLFEWHCKEGLFRGTLEPMVQLTAAPVINGFGSYLVGPSALLRYNFVQPDWRIIPYFQLGPGFVYNDAYRDQSQRAIGQAIEFYLQAQIGFKWFVRDNLSLNIEGGFIHISNCNLATNNLGINSFGGMVGLTYYFPRCWKQ